MNWKVEVCIFNRNHSYSDGIENSLEKKDNKTLAFPLLIQAISTAISKCLVLAIIRNPVTC